MCYGRCTNGESNLLLSLVPFCVVSKENPNHYHRSIQELYKTLKDQGKTRQC